jgi:hypothetical protein
MKRGQRSACEEPTAPTSAAGAPPQRPILRCWRLARAGWKLIYLAAGGI